MTDKNKFDPLEAAAEASKIMEQQAAEADRAFRASISPLWDNPDIIGDIGEGGDNEPDNNGN